MDNKFIYELFVNNNVTHFDDSGDEDRDFTVLNPNEPLPHLGELIKSEFSPDILKVYFNKNIRYQYPTHHYREITNQNGEVVEIVFMVKQNNDKHDGFYMDYRKYYLLTCNESMLWKNICDIDAEQ